MAYFAWQYNCIGIHLVGGHYYDADHAGLSVRTCFLCLLDSFADLVAINGS